MAAAGKAQLDEFIKNYQNTSYQNAVAKARYYKAVLELNEADTDLRLAQAENDEKATLEARQKMDDIRTGLSSDYSKLYGDWLSGGQKGPMPINPLASFNQLGQRMRFNAPMPTGAVNPAVAANIQTFLQSPTDVPAPPVPTAKPVESYTGERVLPDGLFPPQDGYDPKTMVQVYDAQGRRRVVWKNKDGTPNYSSMVHLPLVGRTPLQTPFEPTSPGSNLVAAPLAMATPEAAHEATQPQTQGGGGTEAAHTSWWQTAGNVALGVIAVAQAAQMLRRPSAAGTRMLGRGLQWVGAPKLGERLSTFGRPITASAGEVSGATSPFKASVNVESRGQTVERATPYGSEYETPKPMGHEYETSTGKPAFETESSIAAKINAETETKMAAINARESEIIASRAVKGGYGTSPETQALEFLKNHPEWRSAINKGVRDAGLKGRNISNWSDADIQTHIMAMSTRNVENGASALRRGSAKALQGLTARNLRELGLRG